MTLHASACAWDHKSNNSSKVIQQDYMKFDTISKHFSVFISDWLIVQQSEITDYRLFMPQSTDTDVVMTS
jgi:hypothetical protein